MSSTNKHTPLIPIVDMRDFCIYRGNNILCTGINTVMHTGEIWHIIGTNGIGKTTLLMQIAGLLPYVYHDGEFLDELDTSDSENHPLTPSHDEVPSTKLIINTEHTTKKCLYISHKTSLHASLTALQNLDFLLTLYNITLSKSELYSALAWSGLQGLENVPCNRLSAGQIRRVNLARLFCMSVQDCQLWLLDEPFTALDNDMKVKLEHRMREFSEHGGVILATSHQTIRVASHRLNLNNFIVHNLLL